MPAYRAFLVIFGIACCVLVGMLALTSKPAKKPVPVTSTSVPEHGGTGMAFAQPSPEEIQIGLKVNGAIEVDGAAVTLPQLQQKLTSLADAKPPRAVVLRYEKGAPFQSIRSVLDACQAAQLTNIAFVDTRPDKGSGQE